MYYLIRWGLAALLSASSLSAQADVYLQTKVLLSGAYDSNTGLMNDALRSQNYLPTQQPYSASPFNYTGTESVSSTRLAQTGNQAIVDWVLVELRDKTDPTIISTQQAALVLRDGTVIDPLTEQPLLVFKDYDPDYYRITIKHRNHLGVTTQPQLLDTTPTLIDFSDPTLATEDSLGRELKANKALLWAGDADTNTQLVAQGSNNDTNAILANIVTAPQNTNQLFNYRLKGYATSDLNLDGSTLYAGAGNDLNILQASILLNPTNVLFNNNFIINGTPQGTFDLMAEALRIGSADKVSIADIVEEINTTQTNTSLAKQEVIKSIFKLNSDGTRNANSLGPLDWNPSHDSVVFDLVNYGNNTPILVSNHAQKTTNYKKNTLAVAGTQANGARYALLASNALSDLVKTSTTTSSNPPFQAFLESLIAWLTQNENFKTTPAKIVIAHQSDSYWFKQDASTNQWFTTYYPQATKNAPDACESINLASCLTDADLLIMGHDDGTEDTHGIAFDLTATMNAVKQAQAAGVPILYIHYDGGNNPLGTQLFDYFGVTGTDNYSRLDDLVSFDPVTLLSDAPSGLDKLPLTIATLMNDNTSFTYNTSNCINNAGKINCNPSTVLEATSGGTQQSLFYDGLNATRSAINTLDLQRKNVFKLDNGYRLIKLALLLSDKLRPLINYPMDKQTTLDSTFLKAQFADNIINFSRPNNDAQPELGSFTTSANNLLIDQLPTKTIDITQTPTNFSEWSSTGIYIPAGKTITLTRTDTSNTIAKFKVNYQRPTTRLWNTDGYSRPQYLASTEIPLASNQSYSFSNPYGGLLYVGWNATTNTDPIAISASNVIDSIMLSAFDDTSIQTFIDELNNSPTEWVDIKTPYAELHSLKSYLFTAFNRQDGNTTNGYTTQDIKDYISDINTYLIAGNYNFAGFNGVGLPDISNETLAFCNSLGLDAVVYEGVTKNLCLDSSIHNRPAIQHINADISSLCADLCSGNPFDVGGAPAQPLNWSENHEMGHNLQRTRLKIYDVRSFEVSNNIFSLHTMWKSALDKGLTKITTDRTGHKNAFNILQASIAAGTAPSISHPLWVSSGTYDNAYDRLAFYMQLMYTAGSWDFYTKLYIMERILSHAVQNDARWDAVKNQLGLSQYTRTAAGNLNAGDFMYLATSKIMQKDYRDYFAAWGISVSQAAKDQVAANGFTTLVPAALYYIPTGELPITMPTPADLIPLDGVSTWTDPTP
ncbi:ImpA family metalloprotease [Thiofilum flexile]|uniref:ImpA family metalloprotease n=1 Tax=Thiofilum flexile TaxID=125627 RepID=UPI00037194C0|nr:ImpA family metalloprotease [Thiofilum flexile]